MKTLTILHKQATRYDLEMFKVCLTYDKDPRHERSKAKIILQVELSDEQQSELNNYLSAVDLKVNKWFNRKSTEVHVVLLKRALVKRLNIKQNIFKKIYQALTHT